MHYVHYVHAESVWTLTSSHILHLRDHDMPLRSWNKIKMIYNTDVESHLFLIFFADIFCSMTQQNIGALCNRTLTCAILIYRQLLRFNFNETYNILNISFLLPFSVIIPYHHTWFIPKTKRFCAENSKIIILIKIICSWNIVL